MFQKSHISRTETQQELGSSRCFSFCSTNSIDRSIDRRISSFWTRDQMAPTQLRWMVAAMVATLLFSPLLTETAEGHKHLREETTRGDAGRKLLQTCWPGMRVNCPSDTQVECEVGGVGGCSCLAMEACLPNVSGCYVVVDGISTHSCGF